MAAATMDQPHRDPVYDIAKGIAISLVVLAHVNRGLIAADVLAPTGWSADLDRFLYSFFLPLFFFLSGLFLIGSVQHQGRREFVVMRVADLMWLYAVWSLINGTMQILFNRFTSGDVAVEDVLALWQPQGTLWFLPSLAFATVVVVTLEPWRSRLTAWRALLVLLVVALLAWQSFNWWPMTWLNPQLVFFLALGAVIGRVRVTRALDRATVVQLISGSAAGVTVMSILLASGASVPTAITNPSTANIWGRLMGVMCGVLGIVSALGTAALFGRMTPWLASSLALLGKRSLPIYVSHTVFTAGARAVLLMLGVTWLPVLILLGLAAGILGPLLLYAVAQRKGLQWLFLRPRLALAKRTAGEPQ